MLFRRNAVRVAVLATLATPITAVAQDPDAGANEQDGIGPPQGITAECSGAHRRRPTAEPVLR